MDNHNEMKSEFKTAKYIIVSGDRSYSLNNDADIKCLNQSSNKNGENVKVVIIPMAGSEGIDDDNVRHFTGQVHHYTMRFVTTRSFHHFILVFLRY